LFCHAPEVVHPRFREIRVGNDHLLACQSSQARALDADVLHLAALTIDQQQIPDLETPV
jgi:hypothetical protein